MTNPFARTTQTRFSLRQLLQAAMANKWEANRSTAGYILTKDSAVIVLGLSKKPDAQGKYTVERVRVNGTLVHSTPTRRAMEAIQGRFLR